MNLFKRPAYSLLYLTGNKICRLDSDRKGQVIGKLETVDISCDTSSGLPNAIEKFILQTKTPLGRKCWVLYSHLLSYQLSLPEAQIAGVDKSIVTQALQNEYEAFTGETLKSSQLSYQLLNTADEMSQFWCVFIAKETLTKIMERLHHAKSALAGVVHAGGLPRLLTKEEGDSWLRIEYWPNCVFALAISPEHGTNLQIFHPQQNPHWEDELKHWMLEVGVVEQTEALSTNKKLEINPYVNHSYALIPDDSLQLWLEIWLQHLVAKNAAGVPSLQQQINVNRETFYMVGSAIAAIVLCAAHAGWILYQTNSYQKDLDDLNKINQQMAGVQATLKTSQDKLSQLQADETRLTDNNKSIPKAMTALKQRPAMLLKMIALHSPEDVVIEDIKPKEQKIVITGVALRAELSNQLATMIEQPMAEMGWKVSEPNSRSLDTFGKDQGPWEFELTLEDLGLKGFLNSGKP